MATGTDTFVPIIQYFYALTTPDEAEDESLHSVCATIDDAATLQGSGEVIRRCRFEPLDSEERFRVMYMKWFPTDGSEPLNYPVPLSPFDLPPGQDDSHERVEYGWDLLNRADALAEVARRNREKMAEHGDALYGDWAILVEVGQPLPVTLIEISVSRGRIGSEKRESSSPVRIVIPTEDEITNERIASRTEQRERLLAPLRRAAKKKAAKKQPAKQKAK